MNLKSFSEQQNPSSNTALQNHFWQNQKRKIMRLKITREGKILIVIALATGFAALNTGNNLLFFGWGLLLASILISGILSETTLRSIEVIFLKSFDGFAQKNILLDVELRNTSTSIPTFGIDVAAHFSRINDLFLEENVFTPEKNATKISAHTLFQLKISTQESRREEAIFKSEHRGIYELSSLTATTAYPFGFFEKTKTISPLQSHKIIVGPPIIDVTSFKRSLTHHLGGTPSHQSGLGEDFFSLRPYRDGDDLRKVAWRNSARTGRLTVKETEAFNTREVVLVIQLPKAPKITSKNKKSTRERLFFIGKFFKKRRLQKYAARADVQTQKIFVQQAEFLFAATSSLALELLNEEYAVGLLVQGTFIPPKKGLRQIEALRFAFANASLFQIEKDVIPSPYKATFVAFSLKEILPPKMVNLVIPLIFPEKHSANTKTIIENKKKEH